MDELEAALAELEQAREDFNAWLADNGIDPDAPDRQFIKEMSDRQKVVTEAAGRVQVAISNHLRGNR